jgi:hypothetical protein
MIQIAVNTFELIVRCLPRECVILTARDEKSAKCFPTILDGAMLRIVQRNILNIRKIFLTIGLPSAAEFR